MDVNNHLSFFIESAAQEEFRAIDKKVPELPNFITLLHHYFHESAIIRFLHEWEAVFFSILIGTLVSIVFYLGTRKRELIPSKLQNCLELFASYLQNFVVEVLGPEGKKYVPFLGTLFIYIFSMNVFGLIPFMKSPSSNLNVTIGLAIVVFVLVQYLNIRNMGFFGFLYHMAGSPKDLVGWIMVPLMFPLEVLTQLTRPVTLALRLFGNIMGEDILLGVFAIFGLAMLADFNIPVGVPLQIPFLFFALLASTMQALVFTLLTTVYILLSIPHEEEHHP